MSIQAKVHAGVDDAFIVWSSTFIDECRGFSLRRRIKRAPGSVSSPEAIGAADADGFVEEIVSSWVGFADGPDFPPGTRKPTTEWPIQKYFWTDYAVTQGDVVSYKVTPVISGTGAALSEQVANASEWTEPAEIGPDCGGGLSCYFNRGIVASQWLARLLPEDQSGKIKKLTRIIATPDNLTRNFLGGPQRQKIVSILKATAANGDHLFAVLYELDDPELEELLKSLGRRAHIVLGNGSVKKKGADQNSDARENLAPVCDVKNRLSSPRALAHNKFLVVCDAAKKPLAVWTGSMNWTRTGLCTQANNSIFFENPDIAGEYLSQWKLLAAAGDDTPESLRSKNGRSRTTPSAPGLTLWFTPMNDQQDLEFVRDKINAAQQGVLFLMFNPGPMGTLLNVIIERASPSGSSFNPDLYIQGVLNQDPSTKTSKVELFHRSERVDTNPAGNPNADVVLPAAIDQRLKFWVEELKKLPSTFAMVHSKVIVIDPFGARPVVVTGSHNLGPKASGTNDENFLIIEGNHHLATAYASNIMAIYGQYRWRWRQNQSSADPEKHAWKGLTNRDNWQIDDRQNPLRPFDQRRVRELDFWFGRR